MRPTSTFFAVLMLMLVSAAAYAADIRSSVTPKRVESVKKTVTSGRICKKEPCHIETFSGGYFFKGRVRPSARGRRCTSHIAGSANLAGTASAKGAHPIRYSLLPMEPLTIE